MKWFIKKSEHYLTKRPDCKGCPLASKCIGKSHEKRIRITIYKEYYDRALVRSKTRKARYYKILRQSTVEPVFGTLINHLGLRKINTRGIENANKVMLMAAIAYNLKKVLRYQKKLINTVSQRLENCNISLISALFVIPQVSVLLISTFMQKPDKSSNWKPTKVWF